MSVPTSRLIHLPVICGYLYTMTAELSSCYRDCKLARLKYLLSGSSKEKIPGLSQKFSNFVSIRVIWKAYSNTDCRPHPRVSHSAGWRVEEGGYVARICISNKLPGDANEVGLRLTL